MDIDRLCYGCMREKENTDEACPYCGFDNASYEKSRSTRALPLGTILNGKYFLGKVLGEGGFGITYLALDLSLEIPVAVKEYFPVGLAYRDTSMKENTETVSVITGEKRRYYEHGIKTFSDEARNLAKFRRIEGIVPICETFLENNTAYIVMDYIEGKTLKQYLKENGEPLSEDEALYIMLPVLKALEEIHKQSVIHRDISPENIIISNRGQGILIDFGAARFSNEDETKNLTILLKQGYAPIEQYQTEGKQGSYTDIYAVCATIYRMLAGEKPQEAIDRIVEDKVIPLEKRDDIFISHQVSTVIKKGMAVQPWKRYQTVDKLIQALYAENILLYETMNKNEQKETLWKDIVIIYLEILAFILAVFLIILP